MVPFIQNSITMTLEKLHEVVTKILETRPKCKDWEVVIAVKANSMGGTPNIGAERIHPGIDFDRGKVIIYPKNYFKK